jgi:NAD(P)-dependent dehydrogenase (short-subunit alcohol dehydrogenase family)
MDELKGRVALITGGSRGIGKAIAKRFIEAGASVMIVSRKPEGCKATAEELGGDIDWKAGNASRQEDAEACTEATLERFGAIDILVNNAGTSPYVGPIIEIDLPRWEKTLQANMTAALIWTQLAWRKYMQEHGGNVVNISSYGGYITSPIIGAYNITKAGLIHMTKQLASELGPQVRVNAVAPGVVRTSFSQLLWDEGRGEEMAARLPLRRLGEPEDVAEAALFLASDASSWITGQTLVSDGGALVADE